MWVEDSRVFPLDTFCGMPWSRGDGRPLPEVPAPAAVPGDPIKALRACHGSIGLHVDARTACAGWLGERLDLTWAIDVLHPLAQRATSLDHSGFGR
jgi:hypothetical protein